VDRRLPSLIVAAAAFDVALLAQNTLTGVVAALITLAALLVAFSAATRALLLETWIGDQSRELEQDDSRTTSSS
jgi:hypothetical protein